MKRNRILGLIGILLLLGLFLWATESLGRDVEIANFSTHISGRSPEQITNLKLAMTRIDGKILKPADVFSFNDTVGERLRQWGYKGAPTIYEGQIVDTPGGGLCQLSSTIYNTALLSGMEIIERKPHLWVIHSVGPGRDAAILYNKIDLRFKNTHGFPVKIRTEIKGNFLIVRFLSSHELEKQYYIDVEPLQVYNASEIPNEIKTEPGRSLVPKPGKNGIKVKVRRITRIPGNPAATGMEIISIDTYKPVPGGIYTEN
ncbi:MAG: VanW family protein [Firmicutes bacterium]|nr:VanW family protein [Bacillota bacterium]